MCADYSSISAVSIPVNTKKKRKGSWNEEPWPEMEVTRDYVLNGDQSRRLHSNAKYNIHQRGSKSSSRAKTRKHEAKHSASMGKQSKHGWRFGHADYSVPKAMLPEVVTNPQTTLPKIVPIQQKLNSGLARSNRKTDKGHSNTIHTSERNNTEEQLKFSNMLKSKLV